MTGVRKREVKRKVKRKNIRRKEKSYLGKRVRTRGMTSVLLAQKMWNRIKVYQKPANIHHYSSFFLLQFLDSKLICSIFLSKYGSLFLISL